MSTSVPDSGSSGCGAGDCTPKAAAELLNRDCYCLTVDAHKLRRQLQEAVSGDVLLSHPQLFSSTAAYVSAEQVSQMRAIIAAAYRVTSLPAYQEAVLKRAPAIARFVPPGAGVFMGYDFHLSPDGPKVIEINTNAGGAFLNTELLRAQVACCPDAEQHVPTMADAINEAFVEMFRGEWARLHPGLPLRQVTIVDDSPQEQYLYPEFVLARTLFQRHGIDAVIAAPESLSWRDGRLWHGTKEVGLLYNRLTDFYLEAPPHRWIREAYLANAIVLTPNPHVYALFADKSNLALLGDTEALRRLSAAESDIDTLGRGFPRATLLTPENRQQLWEQRDGLFFKPLTGYGGRAAYRGDKITRRVWEQIADQAYIAQERVAPSERGVRVDGQPTALKLDIRAYVYGDQLQLLSARLYQGQTTNFRTTGGGFAPVFVAA